jgi:putative membrane protein
MNAMNGAMGVFGGFGILIWIAIIALVVWAVVRLTRGRTDNGGGDSRERRDPAEDTLRQRYARGEIDSEEYESSLTTLRGGRGERNGSSY